MSFTEIKAEELKDNPFDLIGKQWMLITAGDEEKHNTMITVTHDKRCAAALCDISVWIKDGKTCKIGGKELIDEFFRGIQS